MDLYLSDLDGTLLSSETELTDYTKQVLNKLIARGVHFSIATARTAATVVQILSGVSIKVPVILMNGACVYDLQTGVYLKTEGLPEPAKAALFETLRRHQIEGFVYTIDENRLSTYYERIDTPAARRFVADRERRYGKIFRQVECFSRNLTDKNVLYYSISAVRSRLQPVYEDLAANKAIHVEYYRDIYEQDHWYLEVCAVTASKFSAIQYLKAYCGYSRVICFGDNLNDLPMFRASDEKYAVENALPEVKQQATGVIESNRNDGVAKWLARRFGDGENLTGPSK